MSVSYTHLDVYKRQSLSSATLPQKEDARWHPAAVGRVLFSNAPAGADNRIAPGNNTVPFPGISAPLIFVGAEMCIRDSISSSTEIPSA